MPADGSTYIDETTATPVEVKPLPEPDVMPQILADAMQKAINDMAMESVLAPTTYLALPKISALSLVSDRTFDAPTFFLSPEPVPVAPKVDHPVTTVLRKARALLSDPHRWVKGRIAVTKYGSPVTGDAISESNAFAFCAVGALLYYDDRRDGLLAMEARSILSEAIGGQYVESWNDNQANHADLMAAFDRAIGIAERRYGN